VELVFKVSFVIENYRTTAEAPNCWSFEILLYRTSSTISGLLNLMLGP